MKLQKINIFNFLGAEHVEVETRETVQLFCGANGAGKSSVRDGVVLALTADLGRVSLKKEAAQLVREGQKYANCDVYTTDGDSYAVTITDGGKITDSRVGLRDVEVLPFVLDAQRFAGLSANERRTFLMGLMDVQTDPAAIKERLIARQYDPAKVERIAPMLRAGFDAAHKEAKSKATESRGAWKGVTGETFGTEKAKTWKAEVPKFSASKLKELQTELQHCDVAIGSWQQQVGALNSEQKRRSELQAKLPDLREHASRIERIQKKLDTDEQQLVEWEQDLAKTMAAAGTGPRVGLVHDLASALDAMVSKATKQNWNDNYPEQLQRGFDALSAYEREHGKVGASGGDGKAAARLPSIRQSVELSTRSIANDKRDLEAANKAKADIEAIEQELAQPFEASTLEGARKQIDSLQTKRAELVKELDTIQSLKLQAEAAERKTKEAATHAEDAAKWDELAAALAPDGIPAEILAQTLSPINERMAQAALDTNWLKAEISADMAITGDGRDYRLLSESEQWRVDAMVAEAIANLSGMRLLVLDRFDVLEPASRSVLLGWLDVLADMGELDTALVFGTLKAAPDPKNLPPSVAAHWIDHGTVTAPQQLKAAA